MPLEVVILGAGFGGLELSTALSEEAPDDIRVTLIDKGDVFVFGYSKLDVMFGRTTADAVRLPYAAIAKPGVRFVQEEITAIDPETRTVTTGAGTLEADVLVIALGADYDYRGDPGPAQDEEFYSVRGAELMTERIAGFEEGRAIVGVCGAPFKCPPAPSECALLLHDHLTERGLRDRCEITFLIPFQTPVPPSPDTSAALVEAFHECGSSSSPRRASRRRSRRGRDRRRHPTRVRPLPRRAQAPRARRRPGERHGRRRLHPRRLEDARHAVPGCLRGRRRRDRRRAEGRRLLRASGESRRKADRRRLSAGHPPEPYDGLAPATSSSAPAGSAASTSTSSPGRSQRARSRSPPPSSSPRRSTSARAAARGGSASDRQQPDRASPCSECVRGRLPLPEALRDEVGPLLLVSTVQHLEV